MTQNLNELAQAMHDLTGEPLVGCLKFASAIPPDEFEAALAKAKAECQAYIDALDRGENMEVELPPGRRP
jgi:hypothetical protein